MKYFQFKALYNDSRWMTPAYVGVDENGVIQYLSDKAPSQSIASEYVAGFALPGFRNAHSHAFQYAMAGMAEQHEPGASDDFWSWREAMYQCALSMNPQEIQSVACALYVDLLKRGYTHVAEFHYLHHDQQGQRYQTLSEMALAHLAAASEAGIKITIVPVFYQKGNFGAEATPRQRRFLFTDRDEYFRLLQEVHGVVKTIRTASIGFGVHSLRAAEASDVTGIFREGPSGLPFHMHAAEQRKEVADCLQHLGKRPVQWILDNLPADERFHLVHCTHLDDEELIRLASSRANVVLCPGTEGNLGDGIFRLRDFTRARGNWSIGTDSHISINPLEDLRWLDYAQRLTSHQRNTFDDAAKSMIAQVWRSGHLSMGLPVQSAMFAIGQPLDAVVYHENETLLSYAPSANLLPRLLYSGDSGTVYGTLVNGRWVVKNRTHLNDDHIRHTFRKVIHRISNI